MITCLMTKFLNTRTSLGLVSSLVPTLRHKEIQLCLYVSRASSLDTSHQELSSHPQRGTWSAEDDREEW